MQDFWLSLIMVFIAELGDKTQLVSLSLASRYGARTVLAGITVATLLVHVFSTILGNVAGDLLPEDWIRFFAGLAFIFFGLWTLRGDTLDDDDKRATKLSPFFLVATVFFIAELGDKTMLCTVTMATSCAFVPVWIGSTVGMVLSDGLAILVGQYLGARLPEKTVKVGASIIFFIFGILSMIQGGADLPPLAWALGIVTAVIAAFFLFYTKRVTAQPPSS